MKFKWGRHTGYEVSSKGDARFSAFNAMLEDGRSIEQHYQCDVKGYQPGGLDWRLGKGKPPLNRNVNLWDAYLGLWRAWAMSQPQLMRELADLARTHNHTLCDRFASTEINQARALATLLNERGQ